MAGRGKPRKLNSLDAECTKVSSRDLTEGKQSENKTKQKPKKAKQKNPNDAEEKFPPDSTRRQSQDSRAERTCATRTKSTKQLPVAKQTKEIPKATGIKTCSDRAKSQGLEEEVKPETPEGRKTNPRVRKAKPSEMTKIELKDPTEDSVDTVKAKACGTKPKLRKQENNPDPAAKMQNEQYFEKIPKAEQQTRKNARKASEQTTKNEICAGKAKSPPAKARDAKLQVEVQSAEQDTKVAPGKSQDLKSKDMTKEKASTDYILKETLKKMKIKMIDKANAAEVINAIIQNIISHLKQNTSSFKEVQEPLKTGSYYENLKICNPDEFDVMLPILVDRVKLEPFGNDGAFYSVELKRGQKTLEKFLENGILSATKMLNEFREEVKKCVKNFTEWKVDKKKRGCPAVTLTTHVQSVPISLDVVLCLMVKSSWPPFTTEGLKINNWLGDKAKQEYRQKPYYLVPKYEGKGTVESDGVLNKDVWRVSFSHIEKAILKNHGSKKTCCEKSGENCCRKSCLKLLKHLLHLLKERDSSFDKFCSYHAKTTLFHACCLRTDDSNWRASDLSNCFQLLLEDFECYLENGKLCNFFIPSQNLFSGIRKCKCLSDAIREERLNGFPIFREQLKNGH
ncbi:cyclic GMP-AMP synthase [Oreochromis niloticus]|uniref:cyclic GMP-AMP synthase n=1 Tax=Oreochromis niloticus TaxID=8128 RepID=UPI00090491ED|nr:cyclic GMP-AMP synthase [Oreochromis niloticus]